MSGPGPVRVDFAGVGEHAASTAAPPLRVTLGEAKIREQRRRRMLGIGALVALALAAVVFALYVLLRPPPRTSVTSAEWTHSVIVERYKLVPHDGPTPPEEAVEVTRAGEQIVRIDKVADGTRTESYTEQERCGEDCRISTSCERPKLKARWGEQQKCKTARHCSPKYCTRTKTRQVPQFKNVRITRPHFVWKEWGWAQQRVVTRAEVGAPPSWPSDDEIALDREVGPGEKERTSQKARYRVVFRTPEGNSINYRRR